MTHKKRQDVACHVDQCKFYSDSHCGLDAIQVVSDGVNEVDCGSFESKAGDVHRKPHLPR